MPDNAPSSQPWAACCSSIASARNNVTSGVAIPSFSPLSMFSARRIRTGTRRSVKIGNPNAASVGARMAPIKSAKPSPSAGNNPIAAAAPRSTVRGMPISRSRAGSPVSLRTSPRSSVAASANSSRASVVSVMRSTSAAVTETSINPSAPGPTTAPARTSTSGIVTEKRPSHPAKAVQRTTMGRTSAQSCALTFSIPRYSPSPRLHLTPSLSSVCARISTLWLSHQGLAFAAHEDWAHRRSRWIQAGVEIAQDNDVVAFAPKGCSGVPTYDQRCEPSSGSPLALVDYWLSLPVNDRRRRPG